MQGESQGGLELTPVLQARWCGKFLGEDSFLEQGDRAVVSVRVALAGSTRPSPEDKVWPGNAGRGLGKKSKHPWVSVLSETGEKGWGGGWFKSILLYVLYESFF